MAELVSLDEVRAAAARVKGVTVRTPLIPFPAATTAADAIAAEPPGKPRLLVKPESLQPTGAFKLRGAYNAISALPASAKANGVVAHSSGNHGFAVAYAAALLGVKAAIVVPDNAAKVKTDAIRQTGAELVRVQPTLAARAEGSRHIATTRGYAEIAEDCASQPPQAVLVPVGGGGLIAGVAVAIKAVSPETRVIGVEPELAADARESLARGIRVAWPATKTARTIADALRVEQVGELTFPHIRELVSDIVTVTEEEILKAIRRLALQARLIAEPGGAVAVAAALFRDAADLALTADGGPVVAVLSGGNIDPNLLAEVLAPESYTG